MEGNQVTTEDLQEILDRIPQKPPFRFIDKILEISDNHVIAQYRLKEDEYFYQGHFPGNPVTPGVILVESMAQAGVVALGIFLLMRANQNGNVTTLLTECDVEFFKIVPPGSLVTIKGEKVFWRRNKLKTKVQLELENGDVAASGIISGYGVAQ